MKKIAWNLGAAILLGITSLFGVSCSCLDQAEDSAAVEALPRTPSVEKQEGLTKSYQIGQDYAHFYEYNHGTDVPISFVNSNRADDYITPLDYFETTKGFNGGTNVGKLTVSGKGLEKIGFYKPSNSFDYTAFKVGENVDFTFDFASVTSCGLADYAIADCATSTADNFYLGGRMGTGALLILKRTADSSSWVKADDVARIGLANGRRLTLSVGGSDLTAGTYYRFVSFYQYSYHYATNPGPLGISGLDIHRYTFFNVMQRVTVYVASGGTDVAFATETSPSQTHDLSLRHYASPVNENKAYLTEENAVEESKDISISLTGEVIKASESDIDVESKVPVYLYNGVESTVTFKAKPSSSASSSSVSASAAANFVYSEHPNSKDPIYFGTNSITKGVFYVQACGQDGSGKRIWTSVGTRNSEDANSISLPTTIFEDYPLYRAAYFYPKTKGDTSLLCSSVAYFSLAIKEGKQFKGKYTVEEGFDSSISVSGFKAAATLNDGSTCYSSFSVACAIPSYVIEYAHNDEPFTVLHVAKKTFTDPGKYRFRVTNAFAESKYTTIYIMDIRDDNGTATFFSKYDGFFLSQEYRVYEPDSRVPCYGLGAPFYMNASPYLPGLYGTIKRIYADGTTQVIQSFEDLHAPLTGVMNEVGDYVAEISPGDPNGAGDRIAYTIFFNVVDPAKYTPRINKDLFLSGVFTSSMTKKVFCVDVPTKGKGNLRYLFPYQQEGYDEALTFAMAQEAKTNVTTKDNVYTYEGKTYTDRFGLYEAIKKSAPRRVQLISVLHKDLATSGDYENQDASTLVLDQDRYVVNSEATFASLLGKPYVLNGFFLTQVRAYESAEAQLIDENGNSVNLPYGKTIDEVATSTGKYKIVERNWVGTTEIEGVYFADGDNTAKFQVAYDSGVGTQYLTIEQGFAEEIRAKSFSFINVYDELDPHDIVTITRVSPASTNSYTMTEVTGMQLNETGSYHIEIENRAGYSFGFDVVIEGGQAA